MPTKDDLEKTLKILKEETAKLQKVNKQRYDRIMELEERGGIYELQLTLLFEHLRNDIRNRGFAQIVQMLPNMRQFWRNKPLSKIEQTIKDMEEKGIFDFDEDEHFGFEGKR